MTAPALDDLVAAVAARWPRLRFESALVTAALADREVDAQSPLAVDIALATALAGGDPAALAVFELEIVPDVRRAIVRLDASGDLVDDVLQQVREKLLVAAGLPRIVEYRGRGSLAAWVQVIAIREALMLRRARRRDVSYDTQPDDALLTVVEADPALAITKRTYRVAFAGAFRKALAALTAHERTLLRMCFVDGIGTEQLATVYGVHRVTMFRWLRDARGELFERIRVDMAAHTGIGADEIDSLIRSVASSLDVGW